MQLTGAAPARPGGDTQDIRSYARRGVRLNARQQRAWDAYEQRWVIPQATQIVPGFRIARAFEHHAPLLVEIGFGVGEALVPLAVGRPDCNVVGFEVWQPGVADCLATLAATEISNLRMSTLDAAWCFEHVIDPETVTELWTFFPDPWPKARHHKRRLINARFAALAASRLVPGGRWRLATDWLHYGKQMQTVLDAEPTLAGGVCDRYAGRPLTRFERRGLAAGRTVTDLTYTRSA